MNSGHVRIGCGGVPALLPGRGRAPAERGLPAAARLRPARRGRCRSRLRLLDVRGPRQGRPPGRVGEGVTDPLPPQNRACASNALGSSHDRFALALRSRLSMAVPCTGFSELKFPSRFPSMACSCDARLPSDGSRRPRFPAVLSTMRALRLPARPPFDLFFSPAGTTPRLLVHSRSPAGRGRVLPNATLGFALRHTPSNIRGGPLSPECFSPCRYLHEPPWLLPAGASVAGRDSHPPDGSAFPRRTQSPICFSEKPWSSRRCAQACRSAARRCPAVASGVRPPATCRPR